MSGRLIITTKKTYCPWNPANVERVLRDERLERERSKRQQQQHNEEEDQSKRRRGQNQEDTNEELQQGHINLFPEAREAEIRLADGSSTNIGDAEKQKSCGIMPVPLGGNESTNRKLGNVPFYMQTLSSQQDGKYGNSSYLGIHGNRGGATSSDKITDTIMRDQFASREEYRKQKNDPMSRFYVDSNDDDDGNIYTRAGHAVPNKNSGKVTSAEEVNNSLERLPMSLQNEHWPPSQSRKRKKPNKSEGDDEDDCSKVSSSSCSLSSFAVSWDRSRKKSRRRHHDEKKSETSKHSSSSHHRRHRSRSNNSPLHSSKKKRHKHKKTKKKHHSKERDDGDRRRKRHNNPSPLPPPLSSPPSHMDSLAHKKLDDQQLLDDMQRRRHDREAREMERQRRLLR